jgi:hypothetical protein
MPKVAKPAKSAPAQKKSRRAGPRGILGWRAVARAVRQYAGPPENPHYPWAICLVRRAEDFALVFAGAEHHPPKFICVASEGVITKLFVRLSDFCRDNTVNQVLVWLAFTHGVRMPGGRPLANEILVQIDRQGLHEWSLKLCSQLIASVRRQIVLGNELTAAQILGDLLVDEDDKDEDE